ncbi:MAG: alpha-hydroxy acid oxidase [Burkholderiaceae bacterium]|jgi:isopentenyl diphosphate isomerase/L-lactate dehydrogenase-like FMN-dependent dehydrogenase
MFRPRISRLVNVEELRLAARRRVPRFAFDFIDGGAGDGSGMAHNRAVLDGMRLVPRYLRDVSRIETQTVLFGKTWTRPYGIAPTGVANLMWPGADLALAKLAHQRGFPYVASTPCSTSIEDLAKVCPDLWFQLYVTRDEAVTRDLIERAHAAGAKALVVTVDTPVPGRRDRNLRNRLVLPLRLPLRGWLEIASHPGWSLATLAAGAPRLANLERYAPKGTPKAALSLFGSQLLAVSTTWTHLESVRKHWSGPLIVKGVLDVDDALGCQALGCDGVLLSNHGGRQLEAAVSPFEVLQAMRERLGAGLTILADSGVRHGSDVVKALGLGADLVLMGRLGLYGMGAGGPLGVAHAFDLLDAELTNTLAQLGATSPTVVQAGTHDGHWLRPGPL